MDDRDKKLSEVYDEIEKDIQLLGTTAIEDKLQDQVGKVSTQAPPDNNNPLGETIEFMRRANIAVWVLTGDKIGTARSIARSCKLIEYHMTELMIDGKGDKEVETSLSKAVTLMQGKIDDPASLYVLITGDAILGMHQSHHLQSKVLLILFFLAHPLPIVS